MRGEDHGHAPNKNYSGGSVHVPFGRVRRRKRKRANDHQRETSLNVDAKKMPIDMLMFMQTTQARIWNKQGHVYVKLPEQWRNS